jgi:hypothetical protein
VSLTDRVARARAVLTWKHWAWTTGIAIFVSLSLPVQNFDVNLYWATRRMMFHTPWFILFGYVFLVAIAFVESGDRRAAPSMSRYVLAALTAGLICIGTAWTLAPFMQMPQQRITEGKVSVLPRQINHETNDRFHAASTLGLDAAFHGCLATLIYARLRNSRRAALSLTEAELGRSEAHRRLLASKLDAAHAEVDPARVIDRLESIGRTYETDPDAADAQLDELISFLRDAIPRLRREEVAGAAA